MAYLPHLFGTLSLDGSQDAAFNQALFRLRTMDREIGAADDAKFDITVFDKREADGVLTAAQKPLGAIDGIERPPACKGDRVSTALVVVRARSTHVREDLPGRFPDRWHRAARRGFAAARDRDPIRPGHQL